MKRRKKQNNSISNITSGDLYSFFLDKVEDKASVDWVFCDIFNIRRNEISLYSDIKLRKNILGKLNKIFLRIIAYQPFSHIIGKTSFLGNTIYVKKGTYIPNLDTEVLVQEAILELEEYIKNNIEINILDICAGSGCISISLYKELNKLYPNKKFNIYATEISKKCFNILKTNIMYNLVNINIYNIDLTRGLILSDQDKFHLIVSNPPYLSKKEMLNTSKYVRYQGKLALDGKGKDGCNTLKRIIKECSNLILNSGGKIILETGSKEKNDILLKYIKKINLNIFLIRRYFSLDNNIELGLILHINNNFN